MSWQALAQFVLAAHLLWIVWLVGGLPAGLALGWPRLRLAHGLSAAGQLGLQVAGAFCPLTRLEEWLRGGTFSYGGSWLAAWLDHLVYLQVSPGLVEALTVCWVAATAASLLIWRPRPD